MGGDAKDHAAVRQDDGISIHAPRVGGDLYSFFISLCIADFNPRPPCGGRLRFGAVYGRVKAFQSTPPVWGATLSTSVSLPRAKEFQSTPPVWGATRRSTPWGWRCPNFNPRPPCGGRLLGSVGRPEREDISIHAPRVGGDSLTRPVRDARIKFQSTPPVWGATG